MIKVIDLLKEGERLLARAEIMNPKVDSELLYCYIANINRSEIFLRGKDEVSENVQSRFFELIGKRTKHIPLQHITGRQNFMGLDFKVSSDVLIPRPETELLVEMAISEINSLQQGKKSVKKERFFVLDLCTGSGAIGISVAKLADCEKIEVTCTDISEKALEVAKLNAASIGVEVEFAQGNLFEAVAEKRTTFDMILSNPPYIESNVIPHLQEEVLCHEPILALDGGKDGLDLYRKIVAEAPDFLNPNGILIMEIGYNQKEALISLIKNNGNYEESRSIQDLAGKDRIIFAKRI